jgi:hypothetical protein
MLKDNDGIVIIEKQLPHDPEKRRWSGLFFQPVTNKYYKVPENASNHPEHRGRSGKCIEVFSTSFGMHWAKIRFDDDMEPDSIYDHTKEDWIRTMHLINYTKTKQ